MSLLTEFEEALRYGNGPNRPILFLDLDGTVLPDEGSVVSPEVIVALNHIKRRFTIVPVTGRKSDRVIELLDQLPTGHSFFFINGGSLLAKIQQIDGEPSVEEVHEIGIPQSQLWSIQNKVAEFLPDVSIMPAAEAHADVVVELDDFVVGSGELRPEPNESLGRICIRFIGREDAEALAGRIRELPDVAVAVIEDLAGQPREFYNDKDVPWQIQIAHIDGNKAGAANFVRTLLGRDSFENCHFYGNSGNDLAGMAQKGMTAYIVSSAHPEFVRQVVQAKIGAEMESLVHLQTRNPSTFLVLEAYLGELGGEILEQTASGMLEAPSLSDEVDLSDVDAGLVEQLDSEFQTAMSLMKKVGVPTETGVSSFSSVAFDLGNLVRRGGFNVYEAAFNLSGGGVDTSLFPVRNSKLDF